MSSLYEIDSSILQLIEEGFTSSCIDMETGEIDEAKIQQYLEQLPVERDQKLEAYGCLIKNLQAEAEALRAEEISLAQRRRQKEKTIERLKISILQSMRMFQERKKETTRVVFSLRQSDSVEVEDIDRLPEAYLVRELVTKADKTAIKRSIKNGIAVQGAKLVVNENLQIK